MRRILFPASRLLGALPLVLAMGCAHGPAGGSAGGWRPPSEAKLPQGFPEPVEPGLIVVKSYPSVRGAAVQVEGGYSGAPWRGFWPLFRHIESADIPMTAPVVSDYGEGVRTQDRGTVRMAFLYPDSSTGRPGRAATSGVEVFDSAPLTVVSIGVDGSYSLASMRRAVAQLDRWLEENAGRWRASGPPRRLSYQQPLPFKRLYSEVQIPIVPQPQAP